MTRITIEFTEVSGDNIAADIRSDPTTGSRLEGVYCYRLALVMPKLIETLLTDRIRHVNNISIDGADLLGVIDDVLKELKERK